MARSADLTILRLPEVKARCGLSRSAIYQQISERRFPLPVAISARSVGWVEAEVDSWIAHQIKHGRKRTTPLTEQ